MVGFIDLQIRTRLLPKVGGTNGEGESSANEHGLVDLGRDSATHVFFATLLEATITMKTIEEIKNSASHGPEGQWSKETTPRCAMQAFHAELPES